ncbi:MAG: hypothetical protein JSU03_13685 [Bacteroidetes bacterium]|nr:hypothetical protein [Bacteroidota bacterium]MBS1758322.1 hypothetical protein [Bacteroidota bacterium]
MNKSNRDLLVMFKQELMTPQAIEHEVEMLHELLFSVERLDNVVKAHEIIDLNKYKLISKHFEIKTFLRRQVEKPFVFLNNKN